MEAAKCDFASNILLQNTTHTVILTFQQCGHVTGGRQSSNATVPDGSGPASTRTLILALWQTKFTLYVCACQVCRTLLSTQLHTPLGVLQFVLSTFLFLPLLHSFQNIGFDKSNTIWRLQRLFYFEKQEEFSQTISVCTTFLANLVWRYHFSTCTENVKCMSKLDKLRHVHSNCK